jgi:flagellar basal-body rod modification protein FlgD
MDRTMPITTSPVTTPVSNPIAALPGNKPAVSSNSTDNDAGSADRFLKLLVTQLQNQDPLNPLDNAQITSQMAQINTVNGISQLNTTVKGLNTQFSQLQALQGAALVGHEVTVQGSRLEVVGGKAAGGFELDSQADAVKIEVRNGAGTVVDTIDLPAQTSGVHAFKWKAPAGTDVADGSVYTFRVAATAGANAVTATPLMRDRVQAVTSGPGGLVLQTENAGNVPYTDIKAFN